MRKMKIVTVTFLLLMVFNKHAVGQDQEIAQLLLNVAKLDAFNDILKNMKDGWKLVSNGYQAVKDISAGNFNIHQVFLDNLMQVSPAVQKYRKVALIVDDQVRIVREYKQAYGRFRNANVFNPDELDYLSRVYDQLFQQSLKNLDALAMVITAGQFRMSDEERLDLIDDIYADVEDQLLFLRDFNGKTAVLALQRKKEQNDVGTSMDLYGIER